MTFRTFQQLTDPQLAKGLNEIDATIIKLRNLRRQEIPAFDDQTILPKVCWKIECYLQGIICRTVSLCDAGKCCWNASNLLGATIIGRAVIETAAVSFCFCHEIDSGVQAKSLSAIDNAVMNVTFASKHSSLKDIMRDVPSVMSSIDRLDKFLFGRDKQNHAVRNVYEFASEFAHPNWVGTVGLFGRIDKDKYTQYFSDDDTIANRVAAYVVMGLGSASIVVLCHKQVMELLPEVAKISKAARAKPDP